MVALTWRQRFVIEKMLMFLDRDSPKSYIMHSCPAHYASIYRTKRNRQWTASEPTPKRLLFALELAQRTFHHPDRLLQQRDIHLRLPNAVCLGNPQFPSLL